MYDGDFSGSTKRLLELVGMRAVKYAEDADVLVFNGGADIGTPIYGEKAIFTNASEPSQRDRVEMEIFAMYPEKLKVGICRGSQLLNCLPGNDGKLWQDVNNHGRDHKMLVRATGEIMMITSTHHQMMRPGPTAEIIATADEATQKDSEHDHWSAKGGVFFADDHKDTEIVWYPNTRSLCIQGHPEYVPTSRFAIFCLDLISQKLSTETATCAA